MLIFLNEPATSFPHCCSSFSYKLTPGKPESTTLPLPQLGSLGSPSFVTLSNLPFRQVLMPPRPALAEAGWPQSRLGALCSPAASWSSAAGVKPYSMAIKSESFGG